jgi:hypothetical protein
MSDRGTAIKVFERFAPNLRAGEISLEEFRVAVTAGIALALSMKVDDCGYLYSKARRACERSGKYNDLDFGAAKRAEPLPRAKPQDASEDVSKVAEGEIVATRPGKGRKDLESITVLRVNEKNQVVYTVSYCDLAEAETNYLTQCNKHAAQLCVLLQGMGPNAGELYALQQGEAEINRRAPV